jgi:oxygen-independent coproporphyrinogen-3 oxidase
MGGSMSAVTAAAPGKIVRSVMGYPSLPAGDPHEAWARALELENDSLRSIYIHIPFCRSRCLFCPFYMRKGSRTEIRDYVSLLLRELMDAADSGLGRLPVNSVYFGGGTPTDLEPEDFEMILGLLRKKYRLANDCEITVEGRITGFSDDKLAACADGGVNRFSIGVQTFDTALRRSVGRVEDKETLVKGLERIASKSQAAVVIDMLYGIPGQTMKSWTEDQRVVLEETGISGFDHYNLNIHRGLPLEAAINSGKLPPYPSAAERFEMCKEGERIMAAAGAVRLSIKHFALDCRERNMHNDIAGRKHCCLPFGAHSGGRLGGFTFHQTDDLNEYRRMVEAGKKPLDRAGIMPPDHNVCSELAGQISRRMGVNTALAGAADPPMASKIIRALEPVVEKQVQDGRLLPGSGGWMRLSAYARFTHRTVAAELMEAAAAAWRENL